MIVYAYFAFVFLLPLVFLMYALPAMHTARLLTWPRAGLVTALTLVAAAFGIAPIGWATGLASMDTMENGPFRFPMMHFMNMLAGDSFVFGATLLVGAVFYKLSGNRLFNKVALRCAMVTVAGLILGQTPFAIRGTGQTSLVLLAATLLMAIHWNTLMAVGLSKWAKDERRRWRIRNYLCIHCECSVSGRDTLCPECGKPCRER